MNTIQISSWGDSLKLMLANVANFIPQLISAIIILIVGIIVARFLGRLVERIINYTKVNQLFHRTGVTNDISRIGIDLNIGYIIGWLVEFFIIIATLASVANLIYLSQIATFLQNVLNYIPNVFVAVIIMAIGLVAGNMLGSAIGETTTNSENYSHLGGFVSNVTRWSVIVFALMTALIQLGVAAGLIEIIFTGFVIAISLAIGLAFGLGGRDRAHDWLERLDESARREGGV